MRIGNRKKKGFAISRNKKNNTWLPVLSMVALAAVLALPAALAWQKLDTPMEQQVLPSYMTQSASSQASENESPEESQSSEQQDSQDGQSSQSQQSSQSSSQEDSVEVPLGDWVNSAYFDDAVFIGDSLTVGIQTYQMMPNAKVLAKEGLNPQTIVKNTAVKNKAGAEVKVIDALAELSPRKIYIMLGSNGFTWLSKDVFISNYQIFLEEVKEQNPNAIIYVQSMPPVTKQKEQGDSRFSNDKIKEYNQAILELCRQEKVHFLDCFAALAGEDGYLPQEASPKDGMHFTATYYRKWIDYLKQHTVPESAD